MEQKRDESKGELMIKAMLTTIDNPHDPFNDFDLWYAWDTRMGYHSSGFLARIAMTSDEISDADQALAIEQAIDEIVRENVLGVHRKVTRDISISKSGEAA
jgi:hypothetical protein